MALVAPLCAGFVADRLLPAERSLALINLLRGAALFYAARAGTFHELLRAMALVGVRSGSGGSPPFFRRSAKPPRW